LGLTITDNLSWSTHTAIVAGKANAKIGFLWRNLRPCPRKLKEQAYFALVRSIVEYSAAVWDCKRTSSSWNVFSTAQHDS